MKHKSPIPNGYHIRRPRRSIRLDKIKPADFQKYVSPEGGPMGGFFCDTCSHFDASHQKCTLGYRPQHQAAEQIRLYELCGQMAFCRALEIE